MRMHSVLGLLVALAIGHVSISGAFSAARPDARTLTCAEVDIMVRKAGKIIMSLSDTRYTLIVSSRRYCLPGQVTRTLRIKTKDQNRCWAGYECVNREDQYN
ncbi:MAG: hypothetical protein ACTSSQ_02755 [Alphaproteobacteria bacterium]